MVDIPRGLFVSDRNHTVSVLAAVMLSTVMGRVMEIRAP